MSLSKMNFSKVWTSRTDFRTYESDEDKVRADMQLLFDELRDAFNGLIDALKASELPFTPVPNKINATDVQAAIESVQAEIAEVTLDQVPNGSVTSAKLSDVDSESGAAVQRDNIAHDAVNGDKIADDAVDNEHIANNAVHREQILNGEVTNDKLAPGVLPNKADLDAGDNLLRREQRRFRTKTPTLSSAYTLALDDAESILYLTNTAARTINIPKNASVAIGVGSVILLFCAGAGNITLHPNTGVSLFVDGATASGNVVIKKRYTLAMLVKQDTNSWVVMLPGAHDNSVQTADLAPGSVTADKLSGTGGVNAAVTADKIAPGAVSFDKTDGTTIQKMHGKLEKQALSGWSGNAVTVTGLDYVTADNDVEVSAWVENSSAGTANWTAYRDCGVRCVAQGVGQDNKGTLTFVCESTPSGTLYFNALIFDCEEVSEDDS